MFTLLVIPGMRVVHVFGLPYAEVACAAPFFQNMPTLVTITINQSKLVGRLMQHDMMWANRPHCDLVPHLAMGAAQSTAGA